MDKLKELIAEGLTQPQIAGKLGKSVSQISRLLKRNGLKTKRYIDRDLNAKSKVCRYCGIDKPIDEFPSAGGDYKRCKCNVCYVAMKTKRKRKIAASVEDIKKNLQCKNCGNDDFRVLDFHHKNDKEFNISEASTKGYGNKKIFEEIAKCEVLCSNCHRILHYEERIGLIA